ncbi:MAG: hypothetical protein A2Y38_20025 [Spirochaetes bacterium GWB1_59_5]|nr:MAG: hypothetical protein A2Y38_20025 [Spirochaetes bacterium GWB1_59_5]
MEAKGFTHDDANNISVDWYTPPWIFEALGIEFDLDPCQPEQGIPWIPTKRRYSLVDDGLVSPWAGRGWLNPPYGKHTSAWLEKMHNHRNGIALVFARTDCAWFHDYVAKADAVLFLRGRIKFVDGLGATGGGGAGSGSMLIAWGNHNVADLWRMNEAKKAGHFVLLKKLK